MTSVPITTAAQQSCSQNGSGAEISLSVPNMTAESLDVYWINFQCQEELMGSVAPDKVFYQDTYDGHEWVFRNSKGDVIQQFTARVDNPLVMLGVAFNAEPVTSECSNDFTDEEVALMVTNNTRRPLLLFWIGFDCKEVLYGVIEGQDRYVQPTFANHDWVVRYVDGRTAKYVNVTATDRRVVIDPPPEEMVNTAPTTVPAATTVSADPNFPVTVSGCEITSVTADMGLDAMYTKYCDYNGLVIVSPDVVDDAALKQAWLMAANVFYNRPDVVESLVKMNFRIPIMDEDQYLSDMPELAAVEDPQLDTYRGYDKVLEEPRVAIIAEENLMCADTDFNNQENILVNSLGNLTRFALVMDLDPTMRDTVEAVRQNALGKGLWSADITDNNGAYWNNGVRTYFNSTDLIDGATDSDINTRAELQGYDVQLFDLIHSIYNSAEWTPVCPDLNAETVAVEPTIEAATIAPTVEPVAETAPETEVAEAGFPVTVSGCEITSVTADMGLDAMYTKYCDYNGLVIVSPDEVDDVALKQAWLMAANVFYNRPDVVESLVKMNFRIPIMDEDQYLSDMPELAAVEDPQLDTYRGYDKVLEEPRVAIIAEENLVCADTDFNNQENILVNSLGNLTRFALVMDLDPTMRDTVEAVRQNALSSGLWSADITDNNGAYWNNGVRTYFNSTDLIDGATDSDINTRAELESYDSELFNLIHSIYNSEDWTPVCPA